MTIYTITEIGERLSSGAGRSSFGLSIFDADPLLIQSFLP